MSFSRRSRSSSTRLTSSDSGRCFGVVVLVWLCKTNSPIRCKQKQMWCVHVSVVRRSSHAIMENCLVCNMHTYTHSVTWIPGKFDSPDLKLHFATQATHFAFCNSLSTLGGRLSIRGIPWRDGYCRHLGGRLFGANVGGRQQQQPNSSQAAAGVQPCDCEHSKSRPYKLEVPPDLTYSSALPSSCSQRVPDSRCCPSLINRQFCRGPLML